MFRFLHKLLRRRDALAEAGRRTSGDAFVQAIGAADLFVIAAMRSEGLDAATFTQEELLAEIERTARDLSEREEFEPFIEGLDGCRSAPRTGIAPTRLWNLPTWRPIRAGRLFRSEEAPPCRRHDVSSVRINPGLQNNQESGRVQ